MNEIKKVKKLTGNKNKVIGSKDYFKELNKDNNIADLLKDASGWNYYDDIKKGILLLNR